MQDTLLKFVNNDLCEASLALLDRLGIKYTRGAEKPLEKTDLFTDKTLSKASTEALNFVTETYFVALIDERTFENNPNNVALSSAIDKAKDEKYNGMFVFAVDVQPKANITRTVAATITRAFNKLAVNKPVVLIIRQSDMLSIATCERSNYAQTWREGEKIGKVSVLRDINCRNPHRGHIDLLSRILVKNATNFDELYKQWLDIFDVKLLSKKFYDDLFKWYEWVMQNVDNGIVKFPAYPKDGYGKESKDETIIRIITRMLFVWFIKEKGLIPENLFNAKFINDTIKDFNPKSLTAHNYYNAILQNLFFATLNCEKSERDFISENNANGTNPGYGVNSLYRGADLLKIDKKDFMELYKTIPYLNGGLFERLDAKGKYYDGFSNEPNRRPVVPDALFFGDSDHCGLIKLFENYVFTVEENTPLEQSVSLDPELLGRVFENLLGAYNPETGTTARKSSGSYYTPREIVEYMVNESLVQHITKCGIDENVIRELLEYKEDDVSDLKEEDRSTIMNALLNVRILDPACGSGAFPMGMLQQMVHILRQIDPNNTKWKDLLKKTAGLLANKAYQETDDKEERQHRLDEIENAFNSSYANPDYARKLFIIQNCIYGVDIQPIAMQISKLRFFISLICEQNNSNIMPLPNLETKFVCANTLIGINKSNGVLCSPILEDKKRELLEVRKQHFYARTANYKKKYRKNDGEIRAELEKMITDLDGFATGEAKQLVAWNPYDQNASSPFFDPEWMFGIKDGFDIVIGNPPYVSYYSRQAINIEASLLEFYKKSSRFISNKKAKGRNHSVQFFLGKGMDLMNKNGLCSYIIDISFFEKPFSDIRKYILDNYHVKEIVSDLVAFDNVASGQIIIELDNNKSDKSIWKTDINGSPIVVSNTLWKTDSNNQFFLPSNDPLLNKIENGTKPLEPDLGIVRTGVNIGGVKSFFLTNEPSNYPFISGSTNVQRYNICYPTGLQVRKGETFFKFDKKIEKYIWDNKIGTPSIGEDNDRFTRPKIIIRQSDIRITAAIDIDKAFHCGYSLFTFNAKDDDIVFLKYVLGVLNSTLMTYYAKEKKWLKIIAGKQPQIRVDDMKKMPICININRRNEKKIVALVDQILAAKKSNPQADTTALERKIDILVYLLYGLTWDEVQIVENSL